MKHWVFNIFILLIITANTVVLAMDQHPMDTTLAEHLETANFVLTLIFLVEMVLKVVALGPVGYLKCVASLVASTLPRCCVSHS